MIRDVFVCLFIYLHFQCHALSCAKFSVINHWVVDVLLRNLDGVYRIVVLIVDSCEIALDKDLFVVVCRDFRLAENSTYLQWGRRWLNAAILVHTQFTHFIQPSKKLVAFLTIKNSTSQNICRYFREDKPIKDPKTEISFYERNLDLSNDSALYFKNFHSSACAIETFFMEFASSFCPFSMKCESMEWWDNINQGANWGIKGIPSGEGNISF